eukprot:365186-Chlamydomonas_euryale.AAC.6
MPEGRLQIPCMVADMPKGRLQTPCMVADMPEGRLQTPCIAATCTRMCVGIRPSPFAWCSHFPKPLLLASSQHVLWGAPGRQHRAAGLCRATSATSSGCSSATRRVLVAGPATVAAAALPPQQPRIEAQHEDVGKHDDQHDALPCKKRVVVVRQQVVAAAVGHALRMVLVAQHNLLAAARSHQRRRVCMRRHAAAAGAPACHAHAGWRCLHVVRPSDHLAAGAGQAKLRQRKEAAGCRVQLAPAGLLIA